jgi:hypothetical protein
MPAQATWHYDADQSREESIPSLAAVKRKVENGHFRRARGQTPGRRGSRPARREALAAEALLVRRNTAMERIKGFSEDKFLETRATMRGESPRGQVLLAAAFADEALEALLKAKLVAPLPNSHIFGDFGVTSTFSAKIDLAHGVGCISDRVWESLHRLRKLRNDCAHVSTNIDFDSPSVRDRIMGLITLNREFFAFVWSDMRKDAFAAAKVPVPPEPEDLADEMVRVMPADEMFKFWISILVGFMFGATSEVARIEFVPTVSPPNSYEAPPGQ